MKKSIILLLIPLALHGADFSKKLGFQFGLSSSPIIGLKYHFNDYYALGTNLKLELSRDSNDVMWGEIFEASRKYETTVSNHLFLPEIRKVDHYIFVDIGFSYEVYEVDAAPVYKYHSNNTSLLGNWGYGIEYLINGSVSIWGRLNISAGTYTLKESYESSETPNSVYTKRDKDHNLKLLSLKKSAIGISFYLR